MSALTVPEVLRRAVQVLDERGHYKGWYVDPDGGAVCASGACAVAAGLELYPIESDHEPEPAAPAGSVDAEAVWRRAEDTLCMFLERAEVSGGVPDWNDRYERTLDEVRAALLGAADWAEATP